MQKSESIEKLATALSKLQSEMEAVKMSGVNPFHKSKYATLTDIWEAVKSPLTKNGLAVSQIPCGNSLQTMLMHSSGQWIAGEQLLMPSKQDAQSLGSALTYARRYGLSSVLGLVVDEDDDGNSATGIRNESRPSQTQAPQQPKQSRDPVDAILSESAGDQVCKFGNVRIKGKRIKDCQRADLEGYLAWAKDKDGGVAAQAAVIRQYFELMDRGEETQEGVLDTIPF